MLITRSYATILVPSLLTAPRYFSGEVEFGVITQVRLSVLIITPMMSSRSWLVPSSFAVRSWQSISLVARALLMHVCCESVDVMV